MAARRCTSHEARRVAVTNQYVEALDQRAPRHQEIDMANKGRERRSVNCKKPRSKDCGSCGACGGCGRPNCMCC
jgi:hypothetical protein